MPPGTPRLPRLDERLTCALKLAPRCQVIADIGADHGRLSLHLLKDDTCRFAIVADISVHSLEKARRLLRFHGLGERARFVCADGLAALEEPADAVFILGMGADSICRILREGADRLHGAQLILSAQTEAHKLRHTLAGMGYRIAREPVVKADGRYYTVMLAQPGEPDCSFRDLYVGSTLEDTASARLQDYLFWRMQVLAVSKRAQGGSRIQWLKEALDRAKGERTNDL